MNISLFLQMAADAEPDRVALVCDGRRWTYAALLRAAIGAARGIRASGGTHVALLDESSEASAIALFGAAIAGVPYVPLNYRLADADLAALLARIAPAYIVGDVERIARLDPAGGHHVRTRAGFVAKAEAQADGPELDDTDETIAIQLFTSGTTAAPKAAVLRHSNLLSYILGTVEFAAADEDQAALVCVPPYHVAGIAALLSSIYAMRRILLLPAFDPDAWLALVAAERATNAFVVPTMLSRIVAAVEAGNTADTSSLRGIAYGGGRMPLELIDRALDLFPATGFTNAYGLTETSSTVALLGPDEHRAAHRAADEQARARLASVGRPLPTVELEIRDEEGRVLPAGERGEIYVRGDQVSGEYKERSALDAQGWFPTRDAGWIDAEGYLFLAGRADDVIVRGGENISPGEIEDVLLTHAAIADAAAVAVPSAEWGETVGIAIACRPDHPVPDEATLRTLVRDRLRSSRVPSHIVVVDSLPYNEMGKLLRREVRKLFGDRPAMAPAIPLADVADDWLRDLARMTGAPALAAIDGATLLGERAVLRGLRIPGRTSAGGGCRLYDAADGIVALNLARADDHDLLPALFETYGVDNVAALVAGSSAHGLVARGRELGLAIAAVDEAEAPPPACTLLARAAPRPPARRAPRVLDLSSLWAGPLAAHLLALAGADVTKVESRTRPDAMRTGDPALFALLDRGTARIVLDLHDPDDRAALLRLIAASDIVIEAARPRALMQLGIDADAIVRASPGLAWITITGHGAISKAAHRVGFGDDCGVAAGLSAALREASGRTGFVGDAIADPLTGLRAAGVAWAAWASGTGGRHALAMTGVAAAALAAARARDPAALDRSLTAWAAAVGARFPAIAGRAVSTSC